MNTIDQIAAELDDALIELSRRKRPVLSQRARKAARIALIKSAIEKSTEPEFYDQRKWIAQHNVADEHIYDCVGKTVAKAVYYSPAYRESRAAHERWKQDGALVLRESDGALRFEAHSADQAYNAVERHNATLQPDNAAAHTAGAEITNR